MRPPTRSCKADQNHRREIIDRVVERLFVQRLIVDLRANGAEQSLIAVGIGQCEALGAVHAAGAADILDDHLLAENIAQPIRQNSTHDVGWAAGGERHHHGNRPAWPLVGLGKFYGRKRNPGSN